VRISVEWGSPDAAYCVVRSLETTHRNHADPRVHAPAGLASTSMTKAQRDHLVDTFAALPRPPLRQDAIKMAKTYVRHDLEWTAVDRLLHRSREKREDFESARREKIRSNSRLLMDPPDILVKGKMSESTRFCNMLRATQCDIPEFRYILEFGAVTAGALTRSPTYMRLCCVYVPPLLLIISRVL